MAFWSTFFQTHPGFGAIIDALLEQPNEFTLDKLLEDEDLLQECKTNTKLIDYLATDESLTKMIGYVTKEADPTSDIKRKFKYPWVSCELISLDVPQITEALFSNPEHIKNLLAYVEQDNNLNLHLASFVSKILNTLMKSNLPKMLELLKLRENFVSKLVRHIGNPSIVDVLLKTVASENNDVLEWLNECKLIDLLVDLLSPKQLPSAHEEVSQVLVDIVVLINSLHANNLSLSTVLVDRLESEEIITKLISFMLSEEGNGSSTEHGFKVLSSLLEFHFSVDYDMDSTLEALPNFLRLITNHLEQFHSLLKPRNAKKLPLSAVGEIQPLGFERLKVIEFFAILTQANYHCIYKEMIRLSIFKSCIDLFFAYPWNNFLHSTVDWLIQGILSRENDEMKLHILQDCKLIELITEATKLNEEDCLKPKGTRRGYMGHITALSVGILSAASCNPVIEQILENQDWNDYLNGPLQRSLQKEGRDFGTENSLDDYKEESNDDLD